MITSFFIEVPDCGCTKYEPMDAEDVLEREGRI